MKKYVWETNCDTETFFKRLSTETIPFRRFPKFFNKGGIVFKRKSGNRFLIYNQSQFKRNSFVRILDGKVEETPSGIKITANLRMFLFVYIFMSFWFAVVAYAFIVSVFSLSIIGMIVTAAMLSCAALIIKIFKGNPEKIISLMNKLCKCSLRKPQTQGLRLRHERSLHKVNEHLV